MQLQLRVLLQIMQRRLLQKIQKRDLSSLSGWICIRNRIVITISEHICAYCVFACGCVGVGIDEAADVGVVVSGVQIVEACLVIVVVASVSERLILGVLVGNGVTAYCCACNFFTILVYHILFMMSRAGLYKKAARISPRCFSI